MKFRVLIAIFITCVLFDAANAQAAPVRLMIQPKGTNQIAFTLSPVESGVSYEVMARTNGPDGNWIMLSGYIGGSNNTLSVTCGLGGIPGLTLDTLQNWTFFAGRWDDPFGDELPLFYKELVLRIDPYAPGDPYGNPMGDGWDNQQKLQSNMDPYRAYLPPPPQASVSFYQGTNHTLRGHAVLTWQLGRGPVPDYFLIERASRMPRPMTNDFRRMQPPFNGRPGWQREEPFVTGPYEIVARCPGVPGLQEYRYIDPDVNTLFQPLYRIQPHYSPPLRARLHRVDADEIRKTIITVAAQPIADGYSLTVPDPIPYARYLLLVCDKNDPQWRASGYFTSGTNREPVYLRVDKKGMMHAGQSPLAMPEVKFLSDVVEPEFAAGWGEDSDGDGLPDVYEVLVTRTDPDNADTGNTGILDGYKEPTNDGWDNLEKFRRRADPLRPAQPPAMVELIKPTKKEILNAVTPKTDLNCDLQIEIRTNEVSGYQPIEQVPWMISQIMNFRPSNERKDFDARISWKFSEPKLGQYEYTLFERGSSLQALELLIQKISVELAESFKTSLETNPPLSPIDASNKMAAIEHAYRQDEMDKGLAMAEMGMISANQSQDFYGRVVDQHDQPVVDADVNLAMNRSMGGDRSEKTQTDANGFFQFTGIRGESLSITPSKIGYQIEGHGLGLKGLNGPETNPNKRQVYVMWKLVGPEPMIHGGIDFRKINPDGRPFTIDFVKRQITEGTNGSGDIVVQIQRPSEIKPRQKYNWSFTMTAIDGGFIEVTNDDYLNEAPESGYQPQYVMARHATDVLNYSTRELYRTDRTFFVKSRGDKVYGHFHISELEPDYREMAALKIEFYAQPRWLTKSRIRSQ